MSDENTPAQAPEPFVPLGEENKQQEAPQQNSGEFKFPTLGELFSSAWAEYKKRPLHYSAAGIGAFALMVVVEIAFFIVLGMSGGGMSEEQVTSMSGWLPAVMEIMRVFVSGWFMAGLSLVFVNQLFRGGSSLSQLIYSPIHPLIASIAVLLQFVSMGGMILLVIPGVIWSLRFMFADYVAIMKGTELLESFTQSARMTYGFGWKLFWYYIVMALFGISGLLLLGVGIAVTFPISFIMHILIYRALSQRELPHVEQEPSWLVRNVKSVLIGGAVLGLLMVALGGAIPDEYATDDYKHNEVEVDPREVEYEENVG